MFRATICPLSGETTVFFRHLVLVILYGWMSGMQTVLGILYGWPFGMQTVLVILYGWMP